MWFSRFPVEQITSFDYNSVVTAYRSNDTSGLTLVIIRWEMRHVGQDVEVFKHFLQSIWCRFFLSRSLIIYSFHITTFRFFPTYFKRYILLFKRTFDVIKIGLYSSRVSHSCLEIFGFSAWYVNSSTACTSHCITIY